MIGIERTTVDGGTAVGVRRLALLLLLALPPLLAACDTGITSPGSITFPQSNVSFGRHVQPLLEYGCAYSGCHNDVDRAGDIYVTSYIGLFQTPGIVHPGDSTSSILWQIVTQRLPHRDVLIGNLVSPAQAHGIAVWIQEGASNN
ncbi:MAG TPA: hypothetical protein VHI13_07150 [Candidatus Kapabacteria bacterium]|nr:hypothetical protein [Candidatus Kapabacteria bacterium]